MTQLYPILVVAVVLVGDRFPAVAREQPPWGTGAAFAVAWGSVLAVLLFAGVGLRRCEHGLRRGRGPAALAFADRLLLAGRLLLLGGHAFAILVAGSLSATRAIAGDLVLLDELVAMLPPLVGAAGLWWLHYPLERRVREAMLIRRLDLGRPVHPTPGRGRYVLQQLRVQVLLLLVPVTLIVGLGETIRIALARAPDVPGWVTPAATMAAGVAVFVIAPLLARLVLSVEPLAEGPLRATLTEMCERHRVRVAQFLLWKTDGTMINAAVMGLVGPLRYVLLTDSLVETMPPDEIRAVMAHEIGHVRRHHMPWLVISLLAALLLASLIVSLALIGLEGAGARWDADSIAWIDAAAAAVSAAAALVAFGWVSRRYERQADTFAVQHLSGLGLETESSEPRTDPVDVALPDDEAGAADDDTEAPAPDGDGGGAAITPPAAERRVTPEASGALRSALGAVARLNGVDPNRRSWRHGSIAWRQAYLDSTVGQPIERLAIDRVVRRAKLTAALALAGGIAVTVALEHWMAPAPGGYGVPAADTGDDAVSSEWPAAGPPAPRREIEGPVGRAGGEEPG